MPSKFVAARFDRGDLVVVVHLDDSIVDADGNPRGDSVREYRYGAPKRNSGEAVAAYRARLRAFADTQIGEAKLLAKADRTISVPDPAGQVTLAEEGTTF